MVDDGWRRRRWWLEMTVVVVDINREQTVDKNKSIVNTNLSDGGGGPDRSDGGQDKDDDDRDEIRGPNMTETIVINTVAMDKNDDSCLNRDGGQMCYGQKRYLSKQRRGTNVLWTKTEIRIDVTQRSPEPLSLHGFGKKGTRICVGHLKALDRQRLPIFGNLPFLDQDLHTYFTNLAQKHAREILKDQDINFSNHDVPLTGRAITYGGLDIIWSPYGAEWRMLRKVCLLKLLSRKTLDFFYELRRNEIRERTRYLYEQVGESRGVESVRTEFKGVIYDITRLLGEPNVSDFFPWLARFDIHGLVKRMHNESSIRRDDNNDGECKDFLQYLIKLKDQNGDTEVPITLNHVKALLTDMVVGGTDTTANTIEFAMAELINKPEIIKRAQQELDEVVGKDNIVEESHITRLAYILY
ncbi:hypothetical protein AALP_AA6G182900 [Arabis alpina]|uniref:Cytochrome P450 n=1 Tax=Arabis alpina TaxID=50452 RepID=A0A087GQ15_ARAAL|nr:hypothetical protein AALP_AA6G182900 [Arabis alpina]